MTTYSAIRYNAVQGQPQILSAIDETNLALKQILGFTVGYYGSVIQVTGNSSYAQTLATNYLDSGLSNTADIQPEWGLSFNVTSLSLATNWFSNASYSEGTLNVTYALTGLGISGIAYSASCRLDAQISPSSSNNQVCLTVIRDENEPVIGLDMSSFKFYLYSYSNLTWGMVNPPDEPLSCSNGTYFIDVPSGINPQAVAIQVQDTRGITVAASSFSHYTASLTFNSSFVSGGDYVDQFNSKVDSVSDIGAHSNFTAQQSGANGIFDNINEANVATTNQNYNPSSYSLDGQTTLVSGALSNLAQDDGAYMTFGSYGTGSSAQTLYAHQETTNIAGTNYNNFLVTSADASGTSLTASMANSRSLLGKSVYSLRGITSIPASTWTLSYDAWRDSLSKVTYDSSGSGTSTTSPLNWNHVVGTGNNRLLVVTISISRDNNAASPGNVTAVTYNGVAMTQQVTDVYTSTSNPQVRSYIFYLKNPASGTHQIQVTWVGSSYIVGGSASFANVDQTNPILAQNTSKNYGATQSVSVTATIAGQAVYGSIGSYTGSSYSLTDNAGQTNVWSQTAQRYEGKGDDQINVSPGSSTVGWTTSKSTGYVCLAVVINPAASSAIGHVGADILIRKADNTIRQTIATDVATSGSLATSASTLSGTYNWAAYTVASSTDYLEIDYYVDSTTTDSSNAYLMIDNNALALADQTRITNVMLPNQYTCQAELSGLSNLNNWNNILWAIDAASTSGNVNAVFQLYNYNTGQYATSGSGYLTATLGTTLTQNNQNITINSAQFRDTIGTWKIKFTLTGSTSVPFNVNVDSSTFTAGSATYGLALQEQWTAVNTTYLNLHPVLCINTGATAPAGLAVDVWYGGAWQPVSNSLASGWNNISVSSYLTSPSFTIRFRAGNTVVQKTWQIDSALLRPESDQELFLALQNPSATVAIELLQNGTMRWLGQNLQFNTQTIPIPPISVKAIHINETINGVNQQVPFQIEDWASSYTVPLGLTSNATVFGNRQMVVFLVNTHVSDFTLWWNGSDTAQQTPLAYTSSYFASDNPGNSVISNGQLNLQFSGSFTVTSTVVGTTTSSTSNFMRINNQLSTYGSGIAYVVYKGVIRDIVQQEAEWQNGVSNCPNLYANMVLTLPANATYFTYELSLMFMNSTQTRTITDLCPISLTSTIGQPQTENGTIIGDPVVASGTQILSNSTGVSAHHWSQFTDGTKGAGIMFTDQALKMLYSFDTMPPPTARGALKADAATQTISLLPVTLSPVSFQQALKYNVVWGCSNL